MKYSIIQYPEASKILHSKCRELTKNEILSEEIQNLIAEMKQIMRDAPGVGLAAPQIGISLQLAVIEDSEEFLKTVDPNILKERQRKPVSFHVIINPRIIKHSDNSLYYFEGCLSVSNGVRIVPRYESVVVSCLNEHAEPQEISANGWYARILQHEIDHLHGVLNIDRADYRTEVNEDEYVNKWKYASGIEIYKHYCETCLIERN